MQALAFVPIDNIEDVYLSLVDEAGMKFPFSYQWYEVGKLKIIKKFHFHTAVWKWKN